MSQSSVAAAGNARRQARFRERRDARVQALTADCEQLRRQVQALQAALAEWQAEAQYWETSYTQAVTYALRLQGHPRVVPP